MAPSQTEVESTVIALAGKSFQTFCGDISGMFGVDIAFTPQKVTSETVKGLQTHFKDVVVLYSVKAEGVLDGTFQLVFDQQGLFILAGVVAMHPEHMMLENIKFGSLEKAVEITNILKEVGAALIGSWERVFREGLEGHSPFVQTNTFIGNPWDKSEPEIGLANDEELAFVPCEMTVDPYPTFKCGVIFPKAIFTGTSESGNEQASSDEEKARQEDEEQAAAQTTEPEEDTEESPETEDAAEKVEPAAEETGSAAEQESEATAEQKSETSTEEEPEVVAEEESKAAGEEEPEASAEEDPASSTEDESEEAIKEAKPEAATEEEPEAAAEQESEEAFAKEEPEAAVEEEPEAAIEEQPEVATEEEPEAAVEHESEAVEQISTTTTETDTSEKHPVSDTIRKMAQSSDVLSGESTPSAIADLGLSAKDIMQEDVIWSSPEDSVQQAFAKIQQHDAAYMMIGEGQVAEGIVSKSDLKGALSPYLRPIFAKWHRPMDDATLRIRVKWIMNKSVRTINPDTSLDEIMEDMCRDGIRCLAVADEEGKVQGLVTVFDIFMMLLQPSLHK